jgi:SAM-dependent methyltransferase
MSLLDTLPGTRCRMCTGLQAASTLGTVDVTHDGNFTTRNYSLVLCRACDVVYLDPLPSAADLKLLYEDSKQFTDAHYTAPEQVEKILNYYRGCLRSRDLLPRADSRVLEVGAGLAWVSRASKEASARTVTVAQDVSAECASACPWVDQYFVGNLDQLPASAPFDLASLTHVIEHLADPARMLRTLGRLIAPGGKVFVTAPFRPTGWRAELGIEPWRHYSYLHVPAHITYFSRRWFEHNAAPEFRIVHWSDVHEDGQAFELVLRRN